MAIDFDLKKYGHFVEDYLLDKGLSEFWANYTGIAVNIILLAVFVFALDFVLRKIIVKTFKAFSLRTKTRFDDFLAESNFPRYVAHIIPLIIINYALPVLLENASLLFKTANIIVKGYTIILAVKIVRSVLRSTRRYMASKEQYKDKPLESYQQVLMLFVWSAAIIYGIYLMTGKHLLSIASLGALSAVILLIFKDTILGFVASIQVSINDIVRIGDWITFTKYGADGFVTDINLATVKVQNWDRTYTTIPTYSLISDSFQNWRGMFDSDGRRIKRSVYIKQSSIKFLTPEKIEELKKIELVKPYIEHRQREITRYNETNNVDKSVLINGRNQTNFGVFRKFIDSSLRSNTAINKDMWIMARHLAPTSKGIPLEIYCFTSDKRWVNHEAIMADVFDHIIASVPYFDLEIFEDPTGKDISALNGKGVDSSQEVS